MTTFVFRIYGIHSAFPIGMFAYQNAPIDYRKGTSTVWTSVTSKHEDAKTNRASDTFCGHCLQAIAVS